MAFIATPTELVEALDKGLSANRRRVKLSNLITQYYDAGRLSVWENESVEELVRDSPITGAVNASPQQIRVSPPTWSNLRDYLPWQVRAGLLTGKIELRHIYDALVSPSSHGVADAGLKTGYWWGVPSCLNIEEMLREIADEYNKQTGQVFDWSHLVARRTPAGSASTSSTAQGTAKNMSYENISVKEATNVHEALIGCWIENDIDVNETGDAQLRAVNAEVLKILGEHVNRRVLAALDTMFDEGLSNSKLNPDFVGSYKAVEASGAAPIGGEEAQELYKVSRDLIIAMAEEQNAEVDVSGDDSDADTQSAKKPEFVTLEQNAADMINSVLGRGSNGKFSDINALLREVATVALERDDLVAKLAMAGNTTKMTVSTNDDGTIPDGKVVTKRAIDVFKPASGRVKKEMADMLNFDIDMFEWDGDHPYVPGIDENYVFNPQTLSKILYGLKSGSNVWAHGHTGSGKTTLVEQVAARLGWPVVRVNFDSEIGRIELVGRETLTTDVTTANTISSFINGILPMALEMGAILLFDEFDYIRPDAVIIVQRPLEGEGLMIAEDGARFVPPASSSRIIACCNTRGQGDEYGCYPGARPQPASTLDRFPIFVEVPYLSRQEESRLIQKKVPACSAKVADDLARLAQEVREAFVGGQVFQTISPRGLLSAAAQFAFYNGILGDEKKALRMAIESALLDKSTKQDEIVMKEIAQRVLAI